jgi:cellulose biosynthesis protein BcsQ
MVELIRVVRSTRSDGGPKCLLVPTHVNPRTTAGKEIETVLSKLGEPMGPAMHHRAAFVDAFVVGRWIGDFAYNSAAHRDIKALASAVLQRGKNKSGGKTKRVSAQAPTRAMALALGATVTEEAVEYSDGDS